MSEFTLQLPDEIFTRLKIAADHQQIPLEDLVREAIENYLDEEDEPTNEELLEDLRQSMIDALAGRTRPADEVIDELRRKYQTDANNG